MKKRGYKYLDGVVTKLPDEINPNRMIMEAMDKKYSKCPFCGETRRVDSLNLNMLHEDIQKWNYDSWYGNKKNKPFSLKFWEKDHHWRVDNWECITCGAQWNSEPYPTDISPLAGDMNNQSIHIIGELGVSSTPPPEM